MPIEITGPCELVAWVMEADLVPGAQCREAHGVTWILAPKITAEAEQIITVAGCKVHHLQLVPTGR